MLLCATVFTLICHLYFFSDIELFVNTWMDASVVVNPQLATAQV